MKRGPKAQATNGEPLQRTTLNLDSYTVRLLRVLGEGNASLGARRAAAVAYRDYLRQPSK
jgi:hypothetical protein